MAILDDVNLSIRDGALGRVAQGDGVLAVVGVGSVAQSGVVSLASFDDAKKKVGYGPLRDFLSAFYSETKAAVEAVVLAPGTQGTKSSVAAGADNKGVGSVSVSGNPHNAHKIKIEITEKGGLNAAAFRVSVDGLQGKILTVPSGGTYEEPISGLTFTFAAGTPASGKASFDKGDAFSLSTTAPTASNAAILAAVDKLKNQSGYYRHIAVCGVTGKDFWASFAQKLDEFSSAGRWTWGSVQARYKQSSDSDTDAYINALAGSERGSVESRRLMLCGSWFEGADGEGFRGVRPMQGKIVGRIFAVGVATSPGWVALGNVKGVEKISPFDVNEVHIEEARGGGLLGLAPLRRAARRVFLRFVFGCRADQRLRQ